MSAKMQVLIYSWHTPEQSGGFDWVPSSSEGLKSLAMELATDAYRRNYSHGVLVQLSVALTSSAAVTAYIEEELLELIEDRRIGKIHLSFGPQGSTRGEDRAPTPEQIAERILIADEHGARSEYRYDTREGVRDLLAKAARIARGEVSL